VGANVHAGGLVLAFAAIALIGTHKSWHGARSPNGSLQ
jgi:hypothetical protein